MLYSGIGKKRGLRGWKLPTIYTGLLDYQFLAITLCITFVSKNHINNTKSDICCLLTCQLRSQLHKLPSSQLPEIAASLGIDLSLWCSESSRFEHQPVLAASPGQGWFVDKGGGLWNTRLSPGQSLCMKHQKSIYPPDVTGKTRVGDLSLGFWDEALGWLTLTKNSRVNIFNPLGRGFL